MRRCLALVLLTALSFPTMAMPPPAAAVASAHSLATEAGTKVLAEGGNAFDAAVAVTAVLGVVEPYGSGLGGGGFFLLHEAKGARDLFVDARERAPLAAHRDMFLDELGEPVPRASIDGALAAGIPGTPAALVHLARHYGRLPLSVSLAPAIRLARDGFPVTPFYRRVAEFRLEALRSSPDARRVLLHKGEIPPLGHLVRQPELAATLESIAAAGHDGFYRGAVAQKLVDGVRAAGGIWSADDLGNYRVVEREPIRSRYRGLEIVSAPPPSSGGVALATILNAIGDDDLSGLSSVDRTHLLVEAMRRAYRDRAEYLGDTDFVAVPVARLIHPFYGTGLRAAIRLDRATPSSELPAALPPHQGDNTTHFSLIDTDGNYVAATLSLNLPFGSGLVPPGTGVILNNEMDDFAMTPGVPNAYGLVGGEANAISPGKRMLSSMSPTFVRGPQGVTVLGTPGGSRIISMVLLGILDAAQGSDDVTAWVTRPRFHHQWLPDEIVYEADAFDVEELELLGKRGHTLKVVGAYGNMQIVRWDKFHDTVQAASDPRGEGRAMVLPAKSEETERQSSLPLSTPAMR